MKLFKLTITCCMLMLLGSFTYLKPPKFMKGSAKDLEILKGESSMDVKFDYQDLLISKIPEKEWVAKQKQKGVEDPQKAGEEFNKYWHSEVVPYQEEQFIKWYNANCKDLPKVSKGTKSKYTLTVKAVTLLPYNNFGTIAVLTSDAIISETESGKVLAIINVPNINSGVPALKERVGLAYGGGAKALALFILEGK
jgi:hypothetical protein